MLPVRACMLSLEFGTEKSVLVVFCRYTGVGMQDLVRRSCVGLHQRLTLLCDGVEVPLPPDAEGLVILNIGCHM